MYVGEWSSLSMTPKGVLQKVRVQRSWAEESVFLAYMLFGVIGPNFEVSFRASCSIISMGRVNAI